MKGYLRCCNVLFLNLIKLENLWSYTHTRFSRVFCLIFFNCQNMAMNKVLLSFVPMTWTLWCDIIGGKKSLASTWSELEPGPIISQGYIFPQYSLILILTFFACYRRVSSTIFQGCCREWRLNECAGTMETGGLWCHLCPIPSQTVMNKNSEFRKIFLTSKTIVKDFAWTTTSNNGHWDLVPTEDTPTGHLPTPACLTSVWHSLY